MTNSRIYVMIQLLLSRGLLCPHLTAGHLSTAMLGSIMFTNDMHFQLNCVAQVVGLHLQTYDVTCVELLNV